MYSWRFGRGGLRFRIPSENRALRFSLAARAFFEC